MKSHVANWRSWELNPIVIKELRQAVRSRAVTGMLLLLLLVLFLTTVTFLVTRSFDTVGDIELGGAVFQVFVGILAVASVWFIPLYLGVRVAFERGENNPDLFYISTLTPGQIIRGKFLCGAYMAVLFFSACMPFMAFTNLLRGVDLPTVFFILLFLFLVVCAVNQLAIFFACLPMSRPFKILLGLYGFIQSFWIVVPVIFGSITMMRSGVGAMLATRQFWGSVSTVGGIGLAAVGLFYVLSVALISPPSSNRALTPRIYITVIWFLGAVLSLLWIWKTRNAELILPWASLTFGLMILSLLVTISNCDQLSVRVQNSIPKKLPQRLLAFLFFNGAAGGLLWVALISAATILVVHEVLSRFTTPPTGSTETQFLIFYAASTAYAFAYALSGLLIQRKFFPKRAPKIAALIAMIFAAVWALAPAVVLFFLDKLSIKTAASLELGNVFNVLPLRDDGRCIYHLYFAFGWLAFMMVLSARWFWRQVKNFRPCQKIEAPPVLAEMTTPPAVSE
ncbi:MAG TPA: hypothetical protein VFV23_04955 [Verrucomicrobiae bacterium]|nr:hypothetical protein [Verrucomicrobiae bacterium]